MATERTALREDEFECTLCLRLLFEPATLGCGHSFCKHCLGRLLKSNQTKCPTCRRVLPVQMHARDLATSLSLARLLETVFVEGYEKRRGEVAAELAEDGCVARTGQEAVGSGDDETVLPLFCLDSMLPRQRLRLNVFEPRYLLMVRRCLEGGSRCFGMVGRSRMAFLRYGVEVEVVEHELQMDGRFHIEVVGRRRFEIFGEPWLEDGYNVARVRWMLPSNAPSPQNSAEVLEAAGVLGALVEEWKSLVLSGGWERVGGQLGRCLADIGPLPAATDSASALDRALWVGALINPLPPLGVAPEVRPVLLSRTDSLDALQDATHAIRQSIQYITPSPFTLWVRQQLNRTWMQRLVEALGGQPTLLMLGCKLLLLAGILMFATGNASSGPGASTSSAEQDMAFANVVESSALITADAEL